MIGKIVLCFGLLALFQTPCYGQRRMQYNRYPVGASRPHSGGMEQVPGFDNRGMLLSRGGEPGLFEGCSMGTIPRTVSELGWGLKRFGDKYRSMREILRNMGPCNGITCNFWKHVKLATSFLFMVIEAFRTIIRTGGIYSWCAIVNAFGRFLPHWG